MAETQTSRFRILVVDDSEDILELVRHTLQGEYDVLTLSNPMDLYELMDLFEPDLLVLDIMMPRINGFQLLEMLRKKPDTKDLPIIILSAKSTAGDIKHGYRLGATLYLTKPFTPDRMMKNVKTQFEVHPPASSRKSLSIADLLGQLEMKNCFRKGQAQLSSEVVSREGFINTRQKMEEKILRQQKEAQEARRQRRLEPREDQE